MSASFRPSWIEKQISEMNEIELKSCLDFTETTLGKYRMMKKCGYDSYELNPKISNLVDRKKNIKANLKRIKEEKKNINK